MEQTSTRERVAEALGGYKLYPHTDRRNDYWEYPSGSVHWHLPAWDTSENDSGRLLDLMAAKGLNWPARCTTCDCIAIPESDDIPIRGTDERHPGGKKVVVWKCPTEGCEGSLMITMGGS